MGWACSTNGNEEERVLVGKPVGKRPLGRPRRRWDGVMWTGLVWLRIGTGGELL
jgi:hypothetical protein